MLETIKKWIRMVKEKMLKKESVRQASGLNAAVSDEMAEAIRLWGQMYENNPPWKSETVSTANLPAAIAGEVARLVTLELKSAITGSARADFLNAAYQPLLRDIRRQSEYACAKGGLVFKPYVSDGRLAVDCIQADCFYPVSFDSAGNITGAVFLAQVERDDKYYTRLETHLLTGDGYVIRNQAYKSASMDDLGEEIPLTEVEEWADFMPEVAVKGVSAPLFSYFKIPFANSIDPQSPLGVSVYARAADLICEADRQYSRILWEYEGAELAVDADMTLFKRDENGELVLPQGKERLFRALDLDDSDSKYNVFSPQIRDGSLFNGLNRLFQRIEFACGLAYGTLSDPQTVERTAEEIKSSKQRSYATVADIQKSLRDALTALAGAMDVWCTLGRLAPQGEYDISFEFDDSIVADRRAEFAEKQQLVAAGIMQPWEFRMWYFGEPEGQAKAMCGVEAEEAAGEPQGKEQKTETKGKNDAK